MLSMKENFMRALSGEIPEYVPTYSVFWGVRPSILSGNRTGGEGTDIYGVEWTAEGSAVNAALPKPGTFLLDDIRKWRDVIKYPDFSDINWEELSKKDLENRDPEIPRGGGTATGGFFQALNNFMGFNEGLMACCEEPEEVKALVNFLCDNFLTIADQFLEYYKPDYVSFGDDIAHELHPFISLDMFHDIFEPVWRRYIKHFKDKGYLAMHHNCGRIEDFLDDVVDMGFNGWDPAQVSNDLIGIKNKFGRKFMICGGFDSRPFLPFIPATEEQVRGAVQKVLNELAPGGGYAFFGGAGGEDPVARQRSEWIQDEFNKLRYTYYQ